MRFKEITPVRLYESVINQIIDLIKNNELKPGDKLPPERELAEKLSISRGSLREAFRVLESRGLIKTRPGGGRFVREIDKNAIVDTKNVILNLERSAILELLEAREIVEVKIAELAAQRATKGDIEAIEEIVNKKAIDDKEAIKSNVEFHLAVAQASHNFVFNNIMLLHVDLFKNISSKTGEVPGRVYNKNREHKAIFRAIKEGDSKKAGEAMLKHLRSIREVLMEI